MPIRNSHRAFEDRPIGAATAARTGVFLGDFEALIRWCAAHGCVPRYYREADFRMKPEPYGIDVSRLAQGDRLEALVEHGMMVVEPDKHDWQILYDDLADDDSRSLLLNVLAYRALGWRYVKMPLDNPGFWDCLSLLGRAEAEGAPIDLVGAPTSALKKFDLTPYGFDVRIYLDAFGVFNEFVYSQYLYRGRRRIVAPRPGDCVIDCGACFGGTSLYFADLVAPTGRVVSYEFFPENVAIFKANAALNDRLKDRITLIERPVWSSSNDRMRIEGSGPATQVFFDGDCEGEQPRSGHHVRSITIDDTVASLGLDRVDLIKMDIEGSEMAALRGAKATIRRYRPDLAICVYHKLIDFFEIPREIKELDLGYKFYLQHSTVHGDETVVFATARDEIDAGQLSTTGSPDMGFDRPLDVPTDAARARVADLERDLNVMRSSRSWRATAPLRWAASRMRNSGTRDI